MTYLELVKLLITLVTCHLVGDYILQTRFIAESKDKYLYHLFIHCFLYCLPFAIVFGFTWHLAILFMLHIAIDPLKCKYYVIDYPTDQMLHYATCLIYAFFPVAYNLRLF